MCTVCYVYRNEFGKCNLYPLDIRKPLKFPLPALEIDIKQRVSLRAVGQTNRSVSNN